MNMNDVDLGLIIGLLTIGGSVVTIITWIIGMSKKFDRMERYSRQNQDAIGVIMNALMVVVDNCQHNGADNREITEIKKSLRQHLAIKNG